MQCQLCGQHEAAIHIHCEIVDGAKRTLHLCEFCAAEQDIDPTALDEVSLAQLVLKCTGLAEGMSASAPAPDVDLTCPDCGLTSAELRDNGRLGCAQCYGAFASVLQPLLASMHDGAVSNGGPGPAATEPPPPPAADDRRLRLERQLSAAVEREDYERAAALRDELAALVAGDADA